MTRVKSEHGLTLVELLIASVLVVGVLATVTSLYLSAVKLFTSQVTFSAQIQTFAALRKIENSVQDANYIEVTADQLKIRRDYTNGQPNFTLFNKADDTWHVYGLVMNRGSRQLYWREDRPPAGLSAAAADSWRPAPVTATTPPNTRMEPGLTFDPASKFEAISHANKWDGSPGQPRIVRISFNTTNDSGERYSASGDAIATAMTK